MTSARRVFGEGRCAFTDSTLKGNEKDYIKFSDFLDDQTKDYERVKRDYGFNHDGTEELRLPRMRRQKFVPQKKSELDLFDMKEHIQQGEHFDELFGAEHDDEITVSTDRGDLFNYRITKFDQCGFSKEIEKNIKLRKYELPTPIQRAVIPLVVRTRQDIMGHAQTGSGKTAAFVLPIINEIQRIVDLKKNKLSLGKNTNSLANKDSPYCIILSPTRELVQQLYEETRSFVARTNVSVAQSYGDIPMRYTLDLKDQGCDIFVVTCGRLRHHVMDGHIKLSSLRYFVLDEADKLIKDRQFYASVAEVKSHPNLYPDNRMLLFSATFSNDVQMLAQNYLKTGYYFIRIGKMNKAVDLIRQDFIEVKKYDKLELLVEMLKKNSIKKILPNGDEYLVPELKTIVFVEEKRDSDRIAIALVYHKFKVMSINGDRSQKQRSEALEKFKRGIFHILVATNVLARGINIPGVEHVINYDLPENENDFEVYIHRIGRTGRAGNSGLTTSFFDPTNFSNTSRANYYVQVLTDTKQQIPDFLLTWANGENFYLRGENEFKSSNNEWNKELNNNFGNDFDYGETTFLPYGSDAFSEHVLGKESKKTENIKEKDQKELDDDDSLSDTW
ncbi:hypothetical protein ACQ4LE_006446 [Meloidogyne hapla]